MLTFITMFRSLKTHNITADGFTASLLSCMADLESCEPTVYLEKLTQALHHHKPRALHTTDCLKKAQATIIEPIGN